MDVLRAIVLLSSGLFLGWNLGANDAANIIGSAVGSKMLNFRRAAIISALFVILGASVAGTAEGSILGELGSAGNLEAAFALALSAALALFAFTRLGMPVSTSQAIVGSIIGWNFFAGLATDWGVLGRIAVSWISSPILAALIAAVLYQFMRLIIRKMKLHLFYWDSFLRFALMAAGAYGAFSLGVNNIANVMGVFVPVVPSGLASVTGQIFEPVLILYFMGGLAIAAGILTYSKKVMQTLGSDIIHLSPENALVVVISISTVLLLFSSPRFLSVPVSSSQAAVGAVLGIGLSRGAGQIKFRVLSRIMLGWVVTPVASGLVSFFLLNVLANVFGVILR